MRSGYCSIMESEHRRRVEKSDTWLLTPVIPRVFVLRREAQRLKSVFNIVLLVGEVDSWIGAR